MCMVFILHVCLCPTYMQCLWRTEKGFRFLESTRVTHGSECWKSNLGPLEEQLNLLTTESSFQSWKQFFFKAQLLTSFF